MERHPPAWRRMTAWRGLAVLCASLNFGTLGHAQEAASGNVPAALRGTWVGEESNARQGRDWVAIVVRDDGEIDWYNDLPAKEAPAATNRGKQLKVESISDTHLTLTYQVMARNGHLRNQTVVSTIVLDLKDNQLVGHREFPLDPDRAISLSLVQR